MLGHSGVAVGGHRADKGRIFAFLRRFMKTEVKIPYLPAHRASTIDPLETLKGE